ncbi:MAG TPA: PHP-associated domain-containing protein [Thermodesulfobacteriota bacterium]|nr:PHP-associated domain-containing protein [Thermodesulfobacteriota bacterium]
MHTAEDPKDHVRYTAKELIARAADHDFDVLAITNHNRVTFSQDLYSYAKKRGILLIPGMEITVRRRHVLLLNPPIRGDNGVYRDFRALLAFKNPRTLIVAPHPFFPGSYSLNRFLLRNLDLFDALEYCHFYSPMINFNRRAVEVCETYGIPLMGNSDSHFFSQLGATYSLIDAEKNVDSLFAAIRENRIQVVSRPLKHREMGSIFNRFLRMKIRGTIKGKKG